MISVIISGKEEELSNIALNEDILTPTNSPSIKPTPEARFTSVDDVEIETICEKLRTLDNVFAENSIDQFGVCVNNREFRTCPTNEGFGNIFEIDCDFFGDICPCAVGEFIDRRGIEDVFFNNICVSPAEENLLCNFFLDDDEDVSLISILNS